MRRVFGAQDLFDAVKRFDVQVRALGVTPLEAAVRWLAHHSALREQDGIVLGASKTAQFEETFGEIEKGPLDGPVLGLIEELWGELEESRGGII